MSRPNRAWILKQRPAAVPTREDVDLVEAELGATPDGFIRIENSYFSLDPAIRGWMSDEASYLPPIDLGSPVRSTVVGTVVDSNSPAHAVGDKVYGLGGWETYTTAPAEFFSKIPDDSPFPEHYYLSILGAVGLTPYFGLLNAGEIKEGQTLLMSAAAGAVGSVGGQIAKIKGLRVVGLAG
ncbi:MAG: NADP-dependent oxidoreductase, partial [Pseudomonadota bacterium]